MRFDRTAAFLAAALVTGVLTGCNRDAGTGGQGTSPGTTTTSPPATTTSPPATTAPDTTMPPASAASR
jgi:hypothetical protein